MVGLITVKYTYSFYGRYVYTHDLFYKCYSNPACLLNFVAFSALLYSDFFKIKMQCMFR